MLLPGAFDVDSHGAATYSIPVTVPPGTAGMVPALTLDYSSQAGNGLLGVGWALSGLPSIGRCARTMAQDSYRGAVNYDANDRFCMEGQRLVVISGTYGADGSEYRTEIEGFSKVIAHGVAGTGPAWFEVHTKSGQIMQFGNTTDSRVLAQGKTTARSWAVNKIADTKGNYLTVTYTNDATNGQAYPTQIDYTGNTSAGLTPYNSVQFVYETRPDIVPVYHAGSLQKNTVRLAHVRTYQGANLVLDYGITYDVSPATSRSRVTAVKACSDLAQTTCLPQTTFNWSGTETLPTTITNNLNGNNGLSTQSTPVFADYNADGRFDILWSITDSSQRVGNSALWLSNANNATNYGVLFDNPTSLTAPFSTGGRTGKFYSYTGITSASGGRFIFDDNGDGKSDMLWVKYGMSNTSSGAAVSGGIKLWNSNGDGTFSTITPSPDVIADGSIPVIGDFNGDGKSDILWQNAGTQTCSFYGGTTGTPDSRILWTSTGSGSFDVTSNVNTADGTMGPCSGDIVIPQTTPYVVSAVADFNGDGKTDIIWNAYSIVGTVEIQQRMIWLANGDGTFQAVTNAGGLDCGYYCPSIDFMGFTPYTGDFNGDGKSDLFFLKSSTNAWGVWLSKGDGSFNVLASQINSGLADYYPSLGDFNGDGRQDILWFNPTANARMVWESNGDGTFTTVTTNLASLNGTYVGNLPYVIDLNADGKDDIIWDDADALGRSQGSRGLWSSDSSPSDLLTSFTTGLGLTSSITYKPLTDSSIYAKGAGSVYPIADVQGAAYVVSRVDAANGIGGTYASTYAYSGARVDQNGRGYLGFFAMTVKDMQTGIEQITNYRQDFPYIGLVSSSIKKLGSQQLNATTNTYTAASLGGTRNFVSLQQSVAASADLDGSVMPSVITSYQYDAYGNATQVSVLTPHMATKVTTSTFTNDATNWFLGRLTAATVTSTLDPGVNHAPVAVADALSVAWNGTGTFAPLVNDTDADGDALSIASFTNGAHGTVTQSGAQLTYTPTSGYSGTDSFTYVASDGDGATATGTVNVTVAANQPPVAVNDSVTLARGTSITFDPRVNDSDPEGQALTIIAKTNPAKGSVTILSSGTQLKYQAGSTAASVGTFTFTYTIRDPQGNTATATVTVTVT